MISTRFQWYVSTFWFALKRIIYKQIYRQITFMLQLLLLQLSIDWTKIYLVLSMSYFNLQAKFHNLKMRNQKTGNLAILGRSRLCCSDSSKVLQDPPKLVQLLRNWDGVWQHFWRVSNIGSSKRIFIRKQGQRLGCMKGHTKRKETTKCNDSLWTPPDLHYNWELLGARKENKEIRDYCRFYWEKLDFTPSEHSYFSPSAPPILILEELRSMLYVFSFFSCPSNWTTILSVSEFLA